MAVYKVTFGFQQHTFGATESYYTGDVSESQLGPYIQKLINKRNAILFNTTKWVGVRVGMAPPAGTAQAAPRRSTFLPPSQYSLAGAGIDITIPPEGLIAPLDPSIRSDQARSCLQVQLGFDTDRKTIRYFSFVPDNILYDEPGSDRLGNYPAWQKDYNAFRTELTSGRWYIRARSRAAGFTEIPILNWSSSTVAPTNLGVHVAAAPAPGIVQGDFVVIKSVRRKGTDSLSYNGRYIIDAVNTTLVPDQVIYYLRGTETGDPASIKLLGKIQRIGWAYFPIQLFYPLRAGVHKRGLPFVAPRGRRKTRASLDP